MKPPSDPGFDRGGNSSWCFILCSVLFVIAIIMSCVLAKADDKGAITRDTKGVITSDSPNLKWDDSPPLETEIFPGGTGALTFEGAYCRSLTFVLKDGKWVCSINTPFTAEDLIIASAIVKFKTRNEEGEFAKAIDITIKLLEDCASAIDNKMTMAKCEVFK